MPMTIERDGGMMRVGRCLIGLAVVLTACSPRPDAGAQTATTAELSVHPESRLPVVPLTIRRGDRALNFRVEVATTSAEQARGLMFRAKMEPNEGMIFPFDPPRERVAFWMKNTVIPLDLIFIGADRRILNIAANTVPYSLAPIPAAGVTAAVLEINGGRAAELGIAPGDKVEW
jgi:uncharacterized membrane protein (UPF0127 family)